ncbi:PPC domain-containing protein [Marinibactrum halimedae]|uniref:Peptidase C-terminal archaeal/bacterial domain-containing protein n=1 Tax=Marinibactrum halimedae TaxID=1444977 RepID=A0AA37T4K3_9GAMM|nr:PPC domain-containing protein [Marinibactrum halimedae]MCD9459799.1 PPC domain-containing protein [Marinibactrum halimedae]GLS27008.1 hypothetical protein GCM10007877_27270 [Marinibactrum halimedae]
MITKKTWQLTHRSTLVTIIAMAVSNAWAMPIDLSGMSGFSDQDTETGKAVFNNSDNSYEMRGNRWRATNQFYTITEDSVLTFEFKSNSRGEFHGIGFEEDDKESSNRFFKLSGSQSNWGIRGEFGYTASGEYQTFSIPIGQYYTGDTMRLVLVNDKDKGRKNNRSTFRNIELTSTSNDNDQPPPTTPDNASLTNGNPISGLSGNRSEQLRFTLDIPDNARNLSIEMSGGSGDADLYVAYGNEPQTGNYDCRPYRSGNNEACSFNPPQAGTYHIMINAFSDFSNLTLVANYQEGNDGGGGGGGTPTPPTPGGMFEEFTNASCTDGQYQLTLPSLEVDYQSMINEVEGNETKAGIVEFTRKALSQGYPYMYDVVTQKAQPNCIEDWWWDDGSPNNPEYGWETNYGLIVHECGHEANGFSNYYVSEGYNLQQPRRDYFPRQEISRDPFHDNLDGDANSTYFNYGSTTGDQGIQTMYDEWTEYFHSVAADYQFYDITGTQYHVNYLLNFAWAAPRYLLWAKQNHPQDFEHMMNDFNVREDTLVLWGATFALLDALNNNTSWSPSTKHQAYLDEIRINTSEGQVLLDMIDEVRAAHGCQTN